MTTIAITREQDGEPRVAISPDAIKKLVGLGAKIKVQAGAGTHSQFSDDELKEFGAEIVSDAAAAINGADALLKVGRPTDDDMGALKKGQMLAAILNPYGDHAYVKSLADKGIDAFAMEFMPRITRAQSMDVLSSQSNLAGYKAVVEAAAEFGQAMPMMMTAAGTVPAAKVFVMGAGVAGLQAIATARRLGAVVTATDVRPAAKEQVASLGAKFIAVEDEEFKAAETAAGYAKEMSDAYKAKQAELVAEHVAKQDIVITTALIPGRPAPRLITKAMVESMRPGSVIVDLAAERGGNCELTKPSETVTHKGVKIMGETNLAGKIPVNASSLYARNLVAFMGLMLDAEKEGLQIDWDDEIIEGTALTRDGKVIHPSLAEAASSDAPAKKANGKDDSAAAEDAKPAKSDADDDDGSDDKTQE